jgi:hypothetical protein
MTPAFYLVIAELAAGSSFPKRSAFSNRQLDKQPTALKTAIFNSRLKVSDEPQ